MRLLDLGMESIVELSEALKQVNGAARRLSLAVWLRASLGLYEVWGVGVEEYIARRVPLYSSAFIFVYFFIFSSIAIFASLF